MTETSRPSLNLDGEWALTLPTSSSALGQGLVNVRVPGPWTIQVPGFEDSHETVRYSRTFRLPIDWTSGQKLMLGFGGVNYAASVSVNGVAVGEHVGGWTPFDLDVTDAIVWGADNELEVIVSYPPETGDAGTPSAAEVPHGKQTWYGTGAGIWQSVVLEQRHHQHLTALVVRADAESGAVSVDVRLAEPAVSGQQLTLRTTMCGDAAEAAATSTLTLVDGVQNATITHIVDGPVLWSLDAPNLYDVTVELASDTGVDRQTRTTGFRTFSARDSEVFLNGEPIEIRAVLDQDYHPGSSTIPESTEALEALFIEARRLGFNMLRCHIKRPDHRYYEIADRLGMLVWTELPSWLTMTERGARDGAALLTELIELDGHHPSIVIWTVMNESWGIDLRDAGQRAWLRETFDDVKALVPQSLVVDNSACEPHFHVKSDLDDFHIYRGIPESRIAWDDVIAEFAGRPDWTYSPFGDAERSGAEPLLLSEFGNWGLPYARDQYASDWSEPWWFAAGADWAFGAAEGTGLMGRFESLGLDRVFGSWMQLISALHHAQMVANRYQTGSIRRHGSISGYVLTQLSDVQWEANGLLDMNRRPKEFNEDFRLINGDVAVVLRPDTYSVLGGSELAVTLDIVPPRPIAGYATGDAELRIIVAGETVSSRPVDLTLREESVVTVVLPDTPSECEVAAEVWWNGTLIARDAAFIVVLADERPELARPLIGSDGLVVDWIRALGWQAATAAADSGEHDIDRTAVFVTRAFDARAQAHARSGGRVLVLAEEHGALGDAFDYLPAAKLGPRTGDGDWVPRQEWLRKEGAFAELPGGPLLGIAYEDLLGEFVITGIPAPMRPADVHSAIFSGWLRGAATTTATIAWSDGEVTLTTFRVREQLGRTPLAHVLGRALLAHAAR